MDPWKLQHFVLGSREILSQKRTRDAYPDSRTQVGFDVAESQPFMSAAF